MSRGSLPDLPDRPSSRATPDKSKSSGASAGEKVRSELRGESKSSTAANRVEGIGIGVRSRDGRPVTGSATVRPPLSGTGGGLLIFTDYPFYGGGFGWNACFYGARYPGWNYGPWGPWGYDPFWSPFGYGGYYYYNDPFYGSRGYGRSEPEPEPEPEAPRTGSLRFRVSPASAQVYVDGRLMGRVDDFNGLAHHLELVAGAHQLELRADGYETLVTSVTVKADRTTTERLNLKKIK
jgi:hypothetical protein